MTDSVENRTSGASTGEERLRNLVREAIELVDSLDLPLEIGARLQEVANLIDGENKLGRISP